MGRTPFAGCHGATSAARARAADAFNAPASEERDGAVTAWVPKVGGKGWRATPAPTEASDRPDWSTLNDRFFTLRAAPLGRQFQFG